MPGPRSTAEPSVTTAMFWRLRISADGPSWLDGVGPRVERSRWRRPGGPRAGRGSPAATASCSTRLMGRTVLADADGVVGEDEADLGASTGRRAGSTAACSRRRRRTCRRRAGRHRGAPCRPSTPPMACSRTPKCIWRPPGFGGDMRRGPRARCRCCRSGRRRRDTRPGRRRKVASSAVWIALRVAIFSPCS